MEKDKEDMEIDTDTQPPLEDFGVPTPVKLSLLWASLMALYIYNDFIALWIPGMLEMISEGQMGPLGEATDTVLVGVAIVVGIPATMVFLSSILPTKLSRLLNLVFGPIFCALAVLTGIGAAPFYQLIVVTEVIILLLITWTAFRWPRQNSAGDKA